MVAIHTHTQTSQPARWKLSPSKLAYETHAIARTRRNCIHHNSAVLVILSRNNGDLQITTLFLIILSELTKPGYPWTHSSSCWTDPKISIFFWNLKRVHLSFNISSASRKAHSLFLFRIPNVSHRYTPHKYFQIHVSLLPKLIKRLNITITTFPTCVPTSSGNKWRLTGAYTSYKEKF